jgi:hypothetical protein
VINNEDAYTNTHEVLLTLFSINASSMAMSNTPDFSGASFIPYSTSESFQLSSGEGKKTVYVKFRTDSGGEKTVSDTITIDTVAPTAPRITNPLEVASIYETNPIITGTAEPNTILQLTIDQRPSISLTVPDSGEWSYLPQSPLSLGIHSIKAVNIIDGALNVSPEKLRTFSVVSDVVIPVPGIPEPPKPPVIPTPDEPVEPTTPDEPVEPDEPIAIDKPSLPKAPALSIIDRAIIYIGRVVREISDNAHDVNIIDRTLIAIGNSANTIIDSVPKVEINVFDRTLALFRNATDTFIKTVVRGVPTFPENPVTRSLAYLSSKTDTFDALLSRVNNPFIPDAPKERIVKDVVLPPVVSEKIETVVPEDLVTGKLSFFHPYGNLEIPVSEVDERVEVLTGQRLTLFFKPEREVNTISASLILQTSISLGPQELRFLFIKPANAITVASAKDYLMYETEFTDKDGDGVYEALLYAPVVSGGYILKTEIDYVEGEDEVIEKEFLIDPEGYVFESSRKGQVRLEDSAVTIYYLDPSSNTFVVWDAGLYYQINPHITDNTGQYSFLVPEGTYQLTVTKNGYTSYNGEAFEVKRTAPVHQNIELLPKNIFQTLKSLFLRSD